LIDQRPVVASRSRAETEVSVRSSSAPEATWALRIFAYGAVTDPPPRAWRNWSRRASGSSSWKKMCCEAKKRPVVLSYGPLSLSFGSRLPSNAQIGRRTFIRLPKRPTHSMPMSNGLTGRDENRSASAGPSELGGPALTLQVRAADENDPKALFDGEIGNLGRCQTTANHHDRPCAVHQSLVQRRLVLGREAEARPEEGRRVAPAGAVDDCALRRLAQEGRDVRDAAGADSHDDGARVERAAVNRFDDEVRLVKIGRLVVVRGGRGRRG
jgi:hypothetical protein